MSVLAITEPRIEISADNSALNSLCSYAASSTKSAAVIAVARRGLRKVSSLVGSFGIGADLAAQLNDALAGVACDRPGARSTGSGDDRRSAILEASERCLHNLQARWPAAQQFAHLLVAPATLPDGGKLEVLLLRKRGAAPFDGEQVQMMDGFAEIMASYADLWWRHESATSHWESAVEAFEQLHVGVIFVDRHNRPITSNKTAQTILEGLSEDASYDAGPGAAADPMRYVLDRVSVPPDLGTRAAGTSASRHLAASFDRIASSEAPLISAVALPLGKPGRKAADDAPVKAVFLFDSRHPGSKYQDWIRLLYGLTRLEAQLVTLMIDGHSLDEIAGTLHISIHTARAYLKRIFFKTGVHRQSTLIKLVLLQGTAMMHPERIARNAPVGFAAPTRSSAGSIATCAARRPRAIAARV